MKKAKILSGIIALTLTASLAIPLTAQAFAGRGLGGKGASITKFENKRGVSKKSSDWVLQRLSSLVTDGTITSDQAKAITNALESAKTERQSEKKNRQNENRGKAGGSFASLVSAGTITAEQSKAVMKAIMEAVKTDKENFSLSTVLSDLVSAGTITSEQSSAINTAFESAKTERHSEKKNRQNVNRGKMSGPFASLVSAGTITAEQSKAVMKAIMEAVKTDKENFSLSTVLSALVSAGTITSEQSSAINTAFESAKAERQSERSDRQNERESSIKTALDALVTAGTITSEQETAVISALTPGIRANN